MREKLEYNAEYLYLTTTGHKTGNPHEIEIWYVPYNSCFYLIAGQRENAHWVKNIQQQQQVSFWVQGQTYSGLGRAVDPITEPKLTRTITALMNEKYAWNDGLIIELRST